LSFLRRGLIFAGVAGVVAIVVGAVFSLIAGVAAFLVALMVPMWALGPSAPDLTASIGSRLGREKFGSDTDEHTP
jgi:hypothetical protein